MGHSMRTFTLSLKLFSLIVALAFVASCARPVPSGSYLVQTQGPYILGPGDVLNISVYGDDTLTKTYTVDEGGTIAMPLLGPVQVGGMTAQAAAAKITSALANGYMRAPDVAVEVGQYRPFFIQGAVTKAGQFAYVYGMTVRAAISTAGGYTDTADRGKATIYRLQGDKMVKGVVDLDFPIYPGDTIVVPERWL